MNNFADLAQERRNRQVIPLHDPIPSQTEREAHAFTSGLRLGDRARAIAQHPDLAKRVCTAFGYTDIKQWSGYIPPREWMGKRNTSPLRRAVVEVCAEAWRRENQTARKDTQ